MLWLQVELALSLVAAPLLSVLVIVVALVYVVVVDCALSSSLCALCCGFFIILLFCVYTQTFFHVSLFGHIFRSLGISSVSAVGHGRIVLPDCSKMVQP